MFLVFDQTGLKNDSYVSFDMLQIKIKEIKSCISNLFNSHKDIFFIFILGFFSQFDFFMVEHFLFLIFWEFEDTYECQCNIKPYGIGVDFLCKV